MKSLVCQNFKERPESLSFCLHQQSYGSRKLKPRKKPSLNYLLSFSLAFNGISKKLESIMDIKIEGNPGTGNTLQEILINNVETYEPNATTVVNNHYGDRKASPAAADPATGNADRIQRRAELLQYAGNLRQYVAPGW